MCIAFCNKSTVCVWLGVVWFVLNVFGQGCTLLDLISMAKLPFKAGHLAEVRSFIKGYRGAWFQCKIREITKKQGHLKHLSEYHAYPDDKLRWTMLYQLPPGKTKGKRRELMMRPKYPPTYNEKEMPHVNEVSEVIVIVCDSWKVGDLVDWWDTGCYWCGRITQLFDDQEAQIELNPEPLGEGSSYKVHFKDLRPSLDWSLEHGWTLPIQEDGTDHPRIRLIKPVNQDLETEEALMSAARLSFSSPISSYALVSSEARSKETTEIEATLSKEQKEDIEKSTSEGCGDRSIRKRSLADGDSRQSTAEEEVEVVEDDLNRKKYRVSGGGFVNSKHSDTLEATILDLEEYINKAKWLKKILVYGILSSENQRPQWKFVEPHAVSEIPK